MLIKIVRKWDFVGKNGKPLKLYEEEEPELYEDEDGLIYGYNPGWGWECYGTLDDFEGELDNPEDIDDMEICVDDCDEDKDWDEGDEEEEVS